MNATELFHKDGRPSTIWYCELCRCVSKTQDAAEACCAPIKCQRCGVDVPKARFYLICDACRVLKDEETEAARFEKAEKVTEWSGPVFCDGVGYHEGYSGSLGEFYDALSDMDEPPHVKYVWACREKRFVHYDVGSITEQLHDQAYEDWDPSTLAGNEELQAALDAWAEKNMDQVSWEVDYTKAVLVDMPEPTAEKEGD